MNAEPDNEAAAAHGVAARWTRGALTALVAVVMFAMMALTTVDVAGRAFLNIPIKGSDEIVSFLLAIVIFASLPLVTWDQQHITVTLFDRWIRGAPARVLAALLSVVSTAVVAVIAYRLWVQADLMREGQHITGALQWPIAPVVYAASVLAGFAAAILVYLTWLKLTGREPAAVEPEIQDAGAE